MKLFGKTFKELSKVYVIQFLLIAGGLLANILIARFFGIEKLGIYSYFFSLVALLSVFCLLGLHEGIAKLIAENHKVAKYVLARSLKIALPSILIFSTIVLFILDKLGLNPDLAYFKLFVLIYLLINGIFYLSSGVLRGFKRFALYASFSLYWRLTFVSLIFVAYLLNSFSFVLLSMSLALLIIFPFLFRKIKFPTVREKVRTGYMLRTSIVLLMTQLGLLSLIHVDKLSIRALLPFTLLGQYTAYSSAINILRLGAFVLPIVLVPMAVGTRYKIKESFSKLLLILVPLAFIVGLLSFEIVPLLFGAETRNVSIYLPWFLVLGSSLMVIYSYFNSIYVGEGKSNKKQIKIIFIDFILSFFVNFGLTLLLIKEFGLIGAPMSLIIVLSLKILLNVYALGNLRKNVSA